MARQKTKLCPGCNSVFRAKSSAVVCSARCRKRLERARKALAKEAQTVDKAVHFVARTTEHMLESLEHDLSPTIATEGGYVATPVITGSAPLTVPDTLATPLPGSAPNSNVTPQPIINVPATSVLTEVTPPITPSPAPEIPTGNPAPAPNRENIADLPPPSLASVPHSAGDVFNPDSSASANPPKPEDSLSSASVNPASSVLSSSAVPIAEVPVSDIPGRVSGTHSTMLPDDKPISVRSILRGLNLLYPATALLFTVVGVGAIIFVTNLSKHQTPTASTSLQNQKSVSTNVQQASANTPFDTTPQNSIVQLNRNTVISNGNSFTATGSVVIQNEADSTSAFKIQDAKGDNLLSVDTQNQKVGIGLTPAAAGGALQVSGDINATGAISSKGTVLSSGGLSANNGTTLVSNSGLTINSVLICTAAGCKPDGLVFQGDATTLSGKTSGFYTNASNLNSGKLSDGLLSTNVDLLDANQTVSGNKTFTGINSFTAAGNTFTGDGSGLSALNASNIATGTISDSRLSANVALLNANNVFTGNNAFDGITVQNGNFLFDSATNSVGAFQIQNAAGNDNLLVADTINTRIGIGTNTPNYTLDVNGDINVASGHTFRIGGQNICQSGLCNPSSGSGFYINNTTSAQAGANFNIQSASASSVGGVIQGASGQTADLLEGKNSGGTTVFALDPQGNVNISGSYEINGATLCTAGGCTAASGSGSYIQNGIAMQASANFNIQSANTANVVGILQGKSGQTADILQLKDGNGNVVNSVGANGAVLAKDTSSAGNHSFFQIQGSNFASNLLTADTVTGQILLPNANVSSTALLFAGNANLYAPSNNNLKTDNNLTVGGTYNTNTLTSSQLSYGASLNTAGTKYLSVQLPATVGQYVELFNYGEYGGNDFTISIVAGGSSDQEWVREYNYQNGYSSMRNVIVPPTSSVQSSDGNQTFDFVLEAVNLGANSDQMRVRTTAMGSGGHSVRLNIVLHYNVDVGGSGGPDFSVAGTTGTGSVSGTFNVLNQNSMTFANYANSTKAFQVQNASGTSVLDVDTNNKRVGIGTTAPSDALTVSTSSNDVGITLQGASSGGGGVAPTFKIADSTGTVYARVGIAGAAGNLGTGSSPDDLVIRSDSGKNILLAPNASTGLLLSGSNGSAKFQNFANSTTGFQVQNAGGLNLLTADTSNFQVNTTKLQASSTVASASGGADAQLSWNLLSSTGLTMSGNEITDATRLADTQGDGRTAPDSSTGIWESTTNLVTNGGFESNTTGWTVVNSATLTQDSSTAKFGSHSAQIVTGNLTAEEGLVTNAAGIAISPSTAYTLSAWVYGAAGETLKLESREVGGTGPVNDTNFTTTGVWQRVTLTFTSNSGATAMDIRLDTQTQQAATFWVDGVQLEQKAYATPYVETNGATATRNAANMSGPTSLLGGNPNGTFWVAVRFRPENATAPYVFTWPDQFGGWQNYGYILRPDTQHGVVYGGNFAGALSQSATLSVGTPMTLVMAITPTTQNLSVNGQAFTSGANTTITQSLLSNFSIGSLGNFTNYADGEILWMAAGTGILSSADAATLNNYGNTDPALSNLTTLNSGAATPTMVWNGSTSSYSSSTGTVLQSALTLDDASLYRSAANTLGTNSNFQLQSSTNSTTAFQVQNATGTSVLTVDTVNNRVNFSQATSSSQGVFFGAGDELYGTGGTLKTLSKFWSTALGVGYDPSSITGGVAAFNGSVGIGTNSPSKSLTIKTTAAQDGILIQTAGANQPTISLSDTINNTSGGLRLAGGSSNIFQIGGSSGTSTPEIQVGSDVFGAAANPYLDINTTRIALMNGSVGIGTANPQSALALGSDAGTAASGIKFGSAGDTDLYRAGAGQLKTDGKFYAGSDIVTQGTNSAFIARGASTATTIRYVANVTGDTYDRLQVQANGEMLWGSGSAATDTDLYRSAAGALKTDGSITASGLALGTGSVPTNQVLTLSVPTDANYRLKVLQNGTFYWGDGTNIQDTDLYRSGTGALQTDGSFTVGNSLNTGNSLNLTGTNSALILRNESGSTNPILATKVSGDGNDRFIISTAGELNWGPGNTGADTDLYRSAANVLTLSGTLILGSTPPTGDNSLKVATTAYVDRTIPTVITQSFTDSGSTDFWPANGYGTGGGGLWIAEVYSATNAVYIGSCQFNIFSNTANGNRQITLGSCVAGGVNNFGVSFSVVSDNTTSTVFRTTTSAATGNTIKVYYRRIMPTDF